jgi:hypothetical protein
MYSGPFEKNLVKNKLTFLSTPTLPVTGVLLCSFYLAQRLDDGNVFEIAPLLATNFGYFEII